MGRVIQLAAWPEYRILGLILSIPDISAVTWYGLKEETTSSVLDEKTKQKNKIYWRRKTKVEQKYLHTKIRLDCDALRYKYLINLKNLL